MSSARLAILPRARDCHASWQRWRWGGPPASQVHWIDKVDLLCYKHIILVTISPVVCGYGEERGKRKAVMACEDAWEMQGMPRRVGIVWCLWFGVVVYLIGGCASSARIRVQADDHYRLAQSYLSNESYILAEQEIRKALTLQPDDARYLECFSLDSPGTGVSDTGHIESYPPPAG